METEFVNAGGLITMCCVIPLAAVIIFYGTSAWRGTVKTISHGYRAATDGAYKNRQPRKFFSGYLPSVEQQRQDDAGRLRVVESMKRMKENDA